MADDLTYAAAGVSLEAADAVVERLKGAVRSTVRPGVIDAHGGFAGLLALGGLGYEDPVVVAGTDGVGTKLELHREAGSLHAAGIDCVGMCVNDILCVGAEPLLFLDYVSVGVLDPEVVATLVEGIADGCRQSGAALLGGETAEHPGVMDADSLDYRRLPPTLDAGAGWVSGTYTGESLRRRADAEGKLQDTDDSGADLVVEVAPQPGR